LYMEVYCRIVGMVILCGFHMQIPDGFIWTKAVESVELMFCCCIFFGFFSSVAGQARDWRRQWKNWLAEKVMEESKGLW
jgi:hypothetical protein